MVVRSWIVFLFCCMAALPVAAQPAQSAEQLAALLRQAMQSNDAELIERLVHPGAEPSSIQRLKSFAEIVRKDQQSVQANAVPAGDKEALDKVYALYSVRGLLKPLDVRVREAAERGFKPTLPPLGDIIVFIAPASNPSRGTMMTYMYGKSENDYLIVFNVRN